MLRLSRLWPRLRLLWLLRLRLLSSNQHLHQWWKLHRHRLPSQWPPWRSSQRLLLHLR